MPTRVRTSEVLPAPLGPMMPALGQLEAEAHAATIGVVPPVERRHLFDVEAALGLWQRGHRPLGLGARERLDRPLVLWRAATNARQFAIAVSIGRARGPS